MRSGRLMLHRDHEALRQSLSDANEKSHHQKASLETLLSGNNEDLPPITDLMWENPLPPYFVVPDPLILKHFPTVMRDLPPDHRAEALIRYDCALRIDLVGMLVGALAADH